ncbi:MFS transporter [Persephonella sp.]|uniref:MFS transporter n=1 Tax=Persephonella sp. TaxID=2060922 RepID=UPI002617223D|nr:MFS transporter [Persephonella sp.]
MSKIRVLSWALFDFAETIFSANIISVFFPLWIVSSLGGSSYHYSFTYAISIFVSIIAGIFLGKIADEKGIKDKLFKIFVVLIIILLPAFYFTGSLWNALILFFFLNLIYQQSLVFYNSLLFDVSDNSLISVVSGIGVGIGYIGAIVGLLITNFLSENPQQSFLITAIIFATFALPSVIFLKTKRNKPQKIHLKGIFTERGFLIFLISILLLTDAAHGLIVFMSIYLKKVFGFSQDKVIYTIAFAAIFAVISAPVSGYVMKKIKPEKFLIFVFSGWILGIAMLYFSNSWFIYITAAWFGIMISTLWTTLRVVLIRISPEEELTTRFAFMSISERMASVLSPLTWGVITYILGETIFSYRVAAGVIGLFPLIGLIVYFYFLKRHFSILVS